MPDNFTNDPSRAWIVRQRDRASSRAEAAAVAATNQDIAHLDVTVCLAALAILDSADRIASALERLARQADAGAIVDES